MAQQIFTVRFILFLLIVLIASSGFAYYLAEKQPAKLAAEQTTDQPPAAKQDVDQQIDDALQYSLNGRYQESVAILKPLATQGVTRAKLYLAVAYYHGHGVKRNREKAKQMFYDLQELGYEPGIVGTYLTIIASAPPAT
jgi:TPR repeat protein